MFLHFQETVHVSSYLRMRIYLSLYVSIYRRINNKGKIYIVYHNVQCRLNLEGEVVS